MPAQYTIETLISDVKDYLIRPDIADSRYIAAIRQAQKDFYLPIPNPLTGDMEQSMSITPPFNNGYIRYSMDSEDSARVKLVIPPGMLQVYEMQLQDSDGNVLTTFERTTPEQLQYYASNGIEGEYFFIEEGPFWIIPNPGMPLPNSSQNPQGGLYVVVNYYKVAGDIFNYTNAAVDSEAQLGVTLYNPVMEIGGKFMLYYTLYLMTIYEKETQGQSEIYLRQALQQVVSTRSRYKFQVQSGSAPKVRSRYTVRRGLPQYGL